MTVTLVAGPGGSGSTTIALALAATSVETVLITAAPALPAAAGTTPVTVVRPDARAFVEHHAQTGDDLAVLPREIAALPGVDLLATLSAVAETLRTRPSAELVIDAGAHAIELVGVLERLSRFTDALVPQALRILGRVTARTSGGGLAVWDGILDAALPGAMAVSSASAVVVVPAEPHRASLARLLPAQLSLFGIGTRCLVDRTDRHDVAAGTDDGTLTIPWPTGSAQAPDLSTLLQHHTESSAVADDTVVAVDDGYEWPLPVPGVHRDQLDLERDDDALLISVGAVVRRLELPSVLQRCSVGSARFADGVLTVGFVPDPSRWPAWARQPAATGVGDE
ncbi:MAG: hypothetical protein WKF57_09235 [Nakamurella sp.]